MASRAPGPFPGHVAAGGGCAGPGVRTRRRWRGPGAAWHEAGVLRPHPVDAGNRPRGRAAVRQAGPGRFEGPPIRRRLVRRSVGQRQPPSPAESRDLPGAKRDCKGPTWSRGLLQRDEGRRPGRVRPSGRRRGGERARYFAYYQLEDGTSSLPAPDSGSSTSTSIRTPGKASRRS
jgi:hypothetical protein